ncbi:MAG: DUF4160 domain-containing protein [Planctomycetes bacterium]|nr:DUF4160 domain-containing protein [Planctomycetota bacterium]
MPTISMFLGIIIMMHNTNEHNPPHFHAEYQDHHATFSFDGELLSGSMPPRQTKFIVAWAELHKEELMANWELATRQQPIYKIDPLR